MTLTATNWWLAIIAIAAVLQTTVMVAAAVSLLRLAERMKTTFSLMETEVPAVLRRTSRLIDKVDDLTERLGRAGTAVEDTAEHLADMWDRVRQWTTHVWPVLGAVSAIRAAAAALRKPSKSKSRRASDETAEARFVYEGGAHARDIG